MSILKSIAGIAAGLSLMVFATGANAAAAAPASNEFTPSKVTCLEYTNGLGENSSSKMQSEISRIWTLGYVAGFYKASSTLEMTDDPAEAAKLGDLMLQRCRDSPQASILVVAMKALVVEPHKVPKMVTADFNPSTFTCGQYVDAKAGASNSAAQADLAELWGFGFIQGYKNVAQADMEIPAAVKPQLLGAVARSCGNNRATLFMDLTAAVAEKVKLN
ncbi:MAG: HdeA/HdeB family chaperone [Rhodospirillaceae bacterium]